MSVEFKRCDTHKDGFECHVKFPVYHSRCVVCESRFLCWTVLIDEDFSGLDCDCVEVRDLPKNTGLKCLLLEPWSNFRHFKLVHKDGLVTLSWSFR